MVSRRQFTIGLVGTAFAGLGLSVLGKNESNPTTPSVGGYGPLVEDPNGLLDLPAGFQYRVISQLDDVMSDGLPVPDRADGMGCIAIDEHRVALVRNHELKAEHIEDCHPQLQSFKSDKAYDSFINGVAVPGGTSNLIYNLTTGTVEKQYLSLIGTIRNCAGGTTPWDTWLTCEESVSRADGNIQQDHGYIFEVPAMADGLIEPVPLKAMGRFNHEAAAVDPVTGIVYLTEDRHDSLFYRFIPKVKGQLNQGGQLQALAVINLPQFDSRNWQELTMPVQQWFEVEWIDIDNPESPEDDLRQQGFAKGAAVFARGEGIHWGDNELYFCCTNGGAQKYGQIMRYRPATSLSSAKRDGGEIQLFLESSDKSLFNFGDNLTVTPNGHLLVCEDAYTDLVNNHLRGVTPDGKVYPFAEVKIQTEPAGVCFSPDGATLFVNLYAPTRTLAITGPWASFKAV